MGTYVYALRSPKLIRKVKVQTHTGEVVTVEAASLSYAYKPGWYDRENVAQRYLGASWRMWDNIPNEERPKYAAVTDCDKGHKITKGDHVYFYENGAPSTCDDANGMGRGKSFGTVIEVSRNA
jgi:hypothetical protein